MVIAGIFIGGAATRFGGIAKGLLPAPDGSGRITQRLVNVLRDLHVTPVFVGLSRDEGYASVGLPTVQDRSGDFGPLGGLLGIYDYAVHRRVLVLACDMPFVTKATLERLIACDAPLAAPRRDGRWEPFLSVHDPHVMKPRAEALVATGRRSLQALFEGAEEVPVDPRELEDWDSPEDMARAKGRTPC